MDLNKLDTSTKSDEGAVMELQHPDGSGPLIDEKTGEPITITLHGIDSKKFLQAAHKIASEKARRRGDGGEIRAIETARILAACTKSWRHIYFGSTEELPCTYDNALMLYTERPWIREQVNVFTGDRANYLGN